MPASPAHDRAAALDDLRCAAALQDLCDALLAPLRPTAAQLDAARARADHVGGFLLQDNFCAAYLIGGSVAKDTALRPIKDVDLFVILDEDVWTSTQGQLYQPRTILGKFDARLHQRYGPMVDAGDAAIVRLRRAVSVQFRKDTTVNVDVVPVLRRTRGMLQVLDRWEGSWQDTHPERQTRLLDQHDTARAPLRDALRLLKLWRRANAVALPSYALEVLALQARADGAPPRSAAIFEAVLRTIATTRLEQVVNLKNHPTTDLGAVTILDPAVAGANVTRELSRADRADVVRAAKQALVYWEEMVPIVARDSIRGLKGRVRALFGVAL